MPNNHHETSPITPTSGGEIDQSSVELAKLHGLLTGNELTHDAYEIMPVGEVGYVIRLTNTPAVLGNDFVQIDLDDTFLATTQAKETRLDALIDYANDLGLTIDRGDCRYLLQVTDRFARWPESGHEKYHLEAHRMALGWMIPLLRGIPAHDLAGKIEELETRLVKAHSDRSSSSTEELPFYFDKDRLVQKEDALLSGDIETVFKSTLSPESHEITLAAALELGEDAGKPHQINLGIFTYGDPPFQLAKTLALLERQANAEQPLNISQIWLTRVSKGDFTRQFVAAYRQAGKGQLAHTVGNEIFTDFPHVIMLIDDGPDQLNSIDTTGDVFAAIHDRERMIGSRVVRLIHAGTKSANEPWEVIETGLVHDTREHPEEDFMIKILKTLEAYTYFSLIRPLSGLEPDEVEHLKHRHAYYEEFRKKLEAGIQ